MPPILVPRIDGDPDGSYLGWLYELCHSPSAVVFTETGSHSDMKDIASIFASVNADCQFEDLSVHAKLQKCPGGATQLLDALHRFTGRNDVPLVFVKGDCVGGLHDLEKLNKTGHLKNWFQPHEYDLLVLGGGSGGLAAAKEAATLDPEKKIAVLDFVTPTPQGVSWGLGGTCVNVGCIPKKLMHQAALLGKSIADARNFGWELPEEEVKHNWDSMRKAVQDHISSLNWGYRVTLREKNIKYLNAFGSFVDTHTIKAVNKKGKEQMITADSFLLATGLRPRYLDVPGLKEYCITSDDLFSLPYCPGRTVAFGASYVSLECAGFLRGMGLDVTVVARSILLRGFDQDMANRIGNHMESMGITIMYRAIPEKIEKLSDGQPGLYKVWVRSVESNNIIDIGDYNTILLAVGREAVTDHLNLDAVGVHRNEKNKKVICKLEQSSIPYIYAIGDTMDGEAPELTPLAIQAGRLWAGRRFGSSGVQCDYVNIPTTVFTPLEYGCCGYSEEVAMERFGDDSVQVFHNAFIPLEYTVPNRKDMEHCYAKLICLRPSDSDVDPAHWRVIGLHILGPNAGEITQGFSIALKLNAKKADFDALIGIHPTVAEVFTTLKTTKTDSANVAAEGC